MGDLFTTTNLVALVTLTLLEIVLGIDNIIFIAILSGRLPREQQARARNIGMTLAIVTRILLLLGITWILQLKEPLFAMIGKEISGKDLILLAGGLFLIGKSTYEIHEKLESVDHTQSPVAAVATSLFSVITQIVIIDIVFSLDGIITAVGISNSLPVMITAVILSSIVMLVAAGMVSRFVEEHPTMKILALAFLILIGAMLVIEGWDPEVAEQLHLKNYAYFAMAFSFVVELINMRFRTTAHPVQLHNQPHLSANGTPLRPDLVAAAAAPASSVGFRSSTANSAKSMSAKRNRKRK